MSFFVTGGSGFVGLNLLEQLLGRGERVTTFSLAPPPRAALDALRELPGDLRHVDGDVRDAHAVGRALAQSGASRVIHAAVVTAGVERERRDASGIVSTNVLGTVNVLDAARDRSVERFVYLSSASVYGANASAPESLSEETTVPLPESLYAVTKYAAERVAIRYRTLFDLPVVAARLSAVYGRWEHDTGLRDTLSPPYLLAMAAGAGQPVILPDEGRRDWIYGPDAAAGVLALADAVTLPHPVYNVGPGVAWPLAAWCEKLRARYPRFSFRVATRPEEGDARLAAGARRAPLCTRRLREDTGFTARFDIDAAFDDYVAWREALGDAAP